MKESIMKYFLFVIMLLLFMIPVILATTGLTGCARVFYKDSTPSVKCNFALMMVKLKSIKGNESFEVGEFVRECYKDLDVIRCRTRIYGREIINNEKKKLEFLECLKESK